MNIQTEQLKGVEMLFAAHQDEDPLRIQHAMKHLEFLDAMARSKAVEDQCR